MKCCSLCIGDRHIRRQVFPNASKETGTCDYCNASSQPLISTQDLRDLFELVISIYRLTDPGEKLATLLAQDWAMFDDSQIARADANRLIGDILDDPSYAELSFAPSTEYESDSITRWATFREELMHKNRYFPASDIDHDRLRALLPHLLLAPEEFPETWFRVRIQDGDHPYSIDKMGAPPESRASHGRANPAGIPYLYLASNPTTAIAEVRPYTGERVTVARFQISSQLTLIDLAAPRQTVSPFVLEDEGDIGQLRADIGFLEQLGEELSRPVVPNSAAVAYTPSQYLCEYIKKCGYNGVRYKSSVVEDGVNLALFEPNSAMVISAETHEVTHVSVSHQPIRSRG